MEGEGIPKPFMHRDVNGENTTEPSQYPQGRFRDIEGFTPGNGYLRRTDVVIAPYPEKPPGEWNIGKVVEMKFGADRRNKKQDQAYTNIAGDIDNYQVYRIGGKSQKKDELHCDCD